MMMTSNTATSFAGRIAVVTGANKGIGYFIALHLGLSGLFQHILLGCRNEQLGAQAVQSLHAQLPSTVHVSSSPLTIGDETSHAAFAESVEQRFGKVDVLVNNAGFAFKGSDPTPFEGQTKPTLDINYYGTVDFTEKMLPLLKKGQDPRLVNVASMSGRLRQLSPALQAQFASPDLDMPQLHSLVKDFETSVADGTYQTKGWSNSNYGLSKLALVAATKVWARQHPDIAVNCCCPGYCKTDMTSQRGMRDPAEGARNAVIPATMEKPPTGAFFADFEVAKW